MHTTSPRSFTQIAAICLSTAAFSFSEASASNPPSATKPAEISGVAAKDGLLGTCGTTKFALQRDGVRQYLMASNGEETCKVICKVAPGATFSATKVSEKPEIFSLSVGEDRYALIWFAGGSLSPATN